MQRIDQEDGAPLTAIGLVGLWVAFVVSAAIALAPEGNAAHADAAHADAAYTDAARMASGRLTTATSAAADESKEDEEAVAEHPLSYTWECGADYGGVAPADGSLSEWAPHYYVAHSYGEYGDAILGLEPGDQITINGNLVTVEGALVMHLYAAYEDVMSAVGWDATVFQTCVPDSDDCRFVYARGECSTRDAAEEAKRWAGIDERREEPRAIRLDESREPQPTIPLPTIPEEGQPMREDAPVDEPSASPWEHVRLPYAQNSGTMPESPSIEGMTNWRGAA